MQTKAMQPKQTKSNVESLNSAEIQAVAGGWSSKYVLLEARPETPDPLG